MIRVTPTKLQLKAEDLQEYERHKATWNLSGRNIDADSSEKTRQQNDPSNTNTDTRKEVRARLGITSVTAASK